MRRLLPSIANLYLAAFAVDGLLSVVDDGGAWIGVGHPLGGVRGLVGTLVLALSSLLGLAMSATPRLPWRPLLLAVLYPSIALLLAPIPLLLSFGLDPAGTLPVGLVQIAVAADALFAVRRREGTWWLRPEDGPLFTWRHALLAAFWLGIAVPLGMTVALAGEIVAGVDIASNGFVRLTTRGVELAEHQLIRQGQRVRLVAMMHIGDQGYYEGLVEDLDEPGAIVLVEGVTDPDERIRGRLQYKRVAEALGLDTQATLRARRARVRNADVSTAAFSDTTVTFLRVVGDLYSGGGDPLADLAAVESLSTPEAVHALMADIFDERNEHLLTELASALDETDVVVVPWGAAHMPAIEDALVAEGFEVGGWRTRVVVAWR